MYKFCSRKWLLIHLNWNNNTILVSSQAIPTVVLLMTNQNRPINMNVLFCHVRKLIAQSNGLHMNPAFAVVCFSKALYGYVSRRKKRENTVLWEGNKQWVVNLAQVRNLSLRIKTDWTKGKQISLEYVTGFAPHTTNASKVLGKNSRQFSLYLVKCRVLPSLGRSRMVYYVKTTVMYSFTAMHLPRAL